jgi:hypothetical protein
MRDTTFLSLLALCLIPAALQSQAQAEGSTDIITGRVTDVTGRPVADAQVGATSLGSGLTRVHSTDAEGRYRIFFPETPSQYVVQAKRLGFAPVRRTITRRTSDAEQMTIDLQLGGTPLALSLVEINGSSEGWLLPPTTHTRTDAVGSEATSRGSDATVPNPVAEILAMKDTLHLSAVQIVALTYVSDTLQTKNGKIYRNIRDLLAKAQAAGDRTQMAGSVAMMLEQASGNTAQAISAAEKVLRPEQWRILPPSIRERPDTSHFQTP